MTLKIIEVTTTSGFADTVRAAAEVFGATDVRVTERPAEGYEAVRVLVPAARGQAALDAIHRAVTGCTDWRINVIPVEATLPPANRGADAGSEGTGTTREEIYQDVAGGGRMSVDFIVLVVLSTAVAAIGLISDNVAVIIGAMVIAPLLGPNLAFALAAALGDRALMGRAAVTNAAGVTLSFAICVALGAVLDDPTGSEEIMSRTNVGLEGVALAIASGAAAALSLVTGISSTLVGVMVAVALLPPAATIGIMVGSGNWTYAVGAAMLLAVNVVCVNLSAQAVFLWKGIRPNTWLERRAAKNATAINLAVWGVLLAALIAVIVARAANKLPGAG